jgi:hypothetical protein
MAILQGDVKLIKSSVMDDVPEGGGPPSSDVIVSAVSNEIFDDISELARAGGQVKARKIFVAVQTDDTDKYAGSNLIIAIPPADPLVSNTLFTTGDIFDTRAEATSRVEAYLNAANEWPGFLYENHIAGQRSIQLFQRLNASIPPIGRTLCLRWHEGEGDQKEQYVRVIDVTVEERTFTYNDDHDYQANIVTLDISSPLSFDFPGTAANRSFTRGGTQTIVRDTIVADAADYHGTVKLSQEIDLGEFAIKVEDIFVPLVPSSRTETALLDRRPSAQFSQTLALSPREVEVGGSTFSQRVKIGQENRSFNYVSILSPLPAPGSVFVHFRAQGSNYVVTDDGEGALTGSGSGTINYTTGSIQVTLGAMPDDRSAVIIYFGPNTAYTNRQGQLADFRKPSYTFDLDHDNIVPSSLAIEWTSAGDVVNASDNGTGKLTGDATGSIVYQTGILTIVPNSMIDAGGEFSITYNYKTMEEQSFTGLSPDSTGTINIELDAVPVAGTLRAEWLTVRETSISSGATSASGSTNKSSMTNSSSSNTTATTTAMVDTTKNYRSYTPEVAAAYNMPKEQSSVVASSVTYPDSYSMYAATGTSSPSWNMPTGIEYAVTTKAPVTTTTSSSTSGTGSASTSQGATYSTSSSQTAKNSVTVAHQITDDGDGSWFGTFGEILYGDKTFTLKVRNDYSEKAYESNYEEAKEFESMNETGQATTTAGGGASTTAASGGGGSATAKGGEFNNATCKETFGEDSLVVRYQTGSPSATSHTMTYQPPGVVLDLCPYTSDTVVPGSVRFTWMNNVYDDFEGTIYINRTNFDPGIGCGSMDYTAGTAKMAYYVVDGPASALTLNSLWTRKPREHIANITFNAILAPLQPSGLVFSVLDVSGQQLIGTSDNDGNLAGDFIHGKIDYQSGLVEVQFGSYVLDSGLTAEEKTQWWYNVDDIRVSDSKIWKPHPIDPETMRYNAVAYFYLPLDAEILGLDPVRLPQDGRVPIFRPGKFVVIGNTQSTSPATATNGGTVNCGRERLSRARLIGNNGVVISAGYTVNLNTGVLTFTDVTGYSQPVHVEHRIEDMRQIAEALIDGSLKLTSAVSHDYPIDDTYVSSALIMGDIKARVSIVFDEATFHPSWSNVQQGDPAPGTFNNAAYPIVVTNKGCLTERWAVKFTNTSAFQVIGEHVGVIAVGNTSDDCAPLNPASGEPYFEIPSEGWGLGWATGNVFRFNTVGGYYPAWVLQTVQQGAATVTDDKFVILARGSVDNPI